MATRRVGLTGQAVRPTAPTPVTLSPVDSATWVTHVIQAALVTVLWGQRAQCQRFPGEPPSLCPPHSVPGVAASQLHDLCFPTRPRRCSRQSVCERVAGDVGKTKTGTALLHDEGSGHAYDIRLKLTKEVLTIQKQDVICVSGSNHSANHRTVTLRRQRVGGLGLSVKVNGINVENATHEEVLKENEGPVYQAGTRFGRGTPDPTQPVGVLPVAHFDNGRCGVTGFSLKLPTESGGQWVNLPMAAPGAQGRRVGLAGSPGPSSEPGSGTSSPLFDSGLHLNGNSSNTILEDLLGVEGPDTITWSKRSSAFEVQALDGASSGILWFYTAQESADWLRAVSANISDLTLQNMKMANKCCSPCDQVVHMGWVSERLGGAGCSQTFRSKFLALKGSSFYIFTSPPVSTLDWVQAEKTYNLCEVLFKVHKSKTYVCSWQGDTLCFTVDFALGFTCFDSKTKNVLWRFKFSQLKGSSDDGKARVKLLFQNLDTKQIEMKVPCTVEPGTWRSEDTAHVYQPHPFPGADSPFEDLLTENRKQTSPSGRVTWSGSDTKGLTVTEPSLIRGAGCTLQLPHLRSRPSSGKFHPEFQKMGARAVLGTTLAVACAGAVFSFLLRHKDLFWGE
ncbi:hypothetical protein E2I00_011903 [Balaenoptera physalus]|uniref:Syntrophin C-terminal PH domain-containing protein n=1 Tax=Balaenoptera physalus TaxID=9770 RepID=A0A6A1QAS3_BALPH|nr:hypothetical protein E2I00_011903 [Balaenoptera physalus]